jgi:hypothetical protein
MAINQTIYPVLLQAIEPWRLLSVVTKDIDVQKRTGSYIAEMYIRVWCRT